VLGIGGVLDVERARVLPHALPPRLDFLRVVPIHIRLQKRKSLSIERPWEATAAAPRCFPGLQKQLLHCPDCSNVDTVTSPRKRGGPMAGYTIQNLKDVEDQAPKFGMSPPMEMRMARVSLEMSHTASS